MRLPGAVRGAILALALMSATSAHAERLTLSARTVEQFRVFQELAADANQRKLLANILLAFVPFQPLLGAPNPVTPVQIAVVEWAPLAEAAASLDTIFRGQLIQFCQLQALSHSSASPDYRFWLDLVDTLNGKKTYFPGTWESRSGADSVRAVFSEQARRLNATVSGTFSGNSIAFPVTNVLVINTRRITLNMDSGGEIFRCEATMSTDKRSFSLSCRNAANVEEVTPFVRLN